MRPAFVMTGTVSPTLYPASSALPLSITTSSGAAWTATLDHMDRAQVAVVDVAEAEGGGTLSVAPQRVTVLVDDDRQALHRAVGGIDTIGTAYGRQEVGAHGAAALVAEALTAELLLGPYDRVGVLVDVVEQAVEGVGDRLGEHERAGHERDPEHHRDAGQQKANLLAPDPLERDLPHGVRRPGSSSCRAPCRPSATAARRRWRRRRGTPRGRRTPPRSGRGSPSRSSGPGRRRPCA